MHKTRQKGSSIRSEHNKKSALIIAIISKTHRGKSFMKIINWANISLHFANNGQSANLRVFGFNKLQWDFSLIKIWSEGLKKQLTKYWSFIHLHSSNVNVKIKIHYKQAALTVLSAPHIHSEGFSADLWVTLARKIQPVSRNTAHNSRVQHIWTMIVYYTGATVADFKSLCVSAGLTNGRTNISSQTCVRSYTVDFSWTCWRTRNTEHTAICSIWSEM